jgi:hypothetical protein
LSRKSSIVLVLAFLGTLAGCFDVGDEFTIRPDGTIHFRRTLRFQATPETAETKAKGILDDGTVAGITARERWKPIVKKVDFNTSIDGAYVTVVEDLELAADAAPVFTSIQAEISKRVKVDGQDFPWCPNVNIQKLQNGNTSFSASLIDVKAPPGFDKDQAKATFGERVYSLKLYAPAIVTASPTGVVGAGVVEWKTSLADLAAEQVKETELLAEVGPPFPTVAVAALGVIAIVLFGALFYVLRARTRAELRALRPSAPRTMPEVMESGALPVVPSGDALLSDESEINVDTDDGVPVAGAQSGVAGVVKFKCPSCGVELKVPLNLAGRTGKCRKCGGAFVSPVPAPLKQARAAAAATPQPEPASLREAFSVKKVKCSCGMTSAILKGRTDGEERCPACNQVLVVV